MAVLPCAPRPPEIVFLEQAYSWIPTVVSLTQFAFLFGLTIYMFRSGARQKVRERQAAWYHKAVVDPLIPRIDNFFTAGTTSLHSIADLVDRCRSTGGTDCDRELKKQVAGFKRDLYSLSSDVSRRLLPFDESKERWATEMFEALENEVTEWINQQLIAEPYQYRPDLDAVLNKRNTALIRGLMEAEFERWGWPQRLSLFRSRRSSPNAQQ
jgi:hypothetical protein